MTQVLSSSALRDDGHHSGLDVCEGTKLPNSIEQLAMRGEEEVVPGRLGVGARSVFPLPLTSIAKRASSRSRRCQQRAGWRHRVDLLMHKVVTSLNEVWARAAGSGSGRRPRRRSAVVTGVLDYIKNRVQQFSRAAQHAWGGEQSLNDDIDLETRGDSQPVLGVQYEDAVHVKLTASNVSLPKVDGGQVPLETMLPARWAEQFITGAGIILHGPAPPTPTYHGVEECEYAGVVAACVEAGVAEYVDTEPAVINGLFGVAKSDGTARVILEARLANAHFLTAPSPDLPRVEALAKLAVPPGERLHGGLLDLDQFYHRLILPERYRDYFGLPAVVLASGVRKFVRWRTCPMGWSWAVFLSQTAHLHVLRSRSTLMRRAASLQVAVPRLLGPRDVAVGAYIDDLTVLTSSRRRVNRHLRGLRRAEVIPVKEKKYQPAVLGQGTRIWGVELDERGEFRPIASKLSALLELSAAVVALAFCRPRLLQRLVGKWLWVCLLQRPLLSLFRPLFAQAHSARRRVMLWPSSRRALTHLMNLAPLLVVNPARPHGHVLASDASDLGGGVCVAPTVSTTLFWSLASFSYYKGRGDLASAEYSTQLGPLITAAQFPHGFGWRWRHVQEIIMVKEARALLTSLQRGLNSPRGRGHRHIALVDNQPAVFAFSKGTSSHPIVNSLIQRVAALTLATGSSLDLVWCRSAQQPADAVSRGGP